MNKKKLVIVGMSGGVDSAVAALLLKKQGYEIEGMFMKNWDEDDYTSHCTASQDFLDVQSVCDLLKIKLHTSNFSAEYWDNVFQYFLSEYKSGRTPNPDILCNSEIKFKLFIDYALMLGANYIATGHYVRRKKTELLKGIDFNKDQSYFLHSVSYEKLAKSLFPLGTLTKKNVRKIAKQYKFSIANKKESMGICFIGKRNFNNFIKKYLYENPGNIETIKGQFIGYHNGLMYHTIGQRKGLGIGGCKNLGNKPWYVLDKDIKRNVLIVGQGNDNPKLYSSIIFLKKIFWINPIEIKTPQHLYAKIRYLQKDQSCILERTIDGYRVLFDKKQRAATPGQSVVFYNGDVCLGGGVIESVEKNDYRL